MNDSKEFKEEALKLSDEIRILCHPSCKGVD